MIGTRTVSQPLRTLGLDPRCGLAPVTNIITENSAWRKLLIRLRAFAGPTCLQPGTRIEVVFHDLTVLAALEALQGIDLANWSLCLAGYTLNGSQVVLGEREAKDAQRVGQVSSVARTHDGCTYSHLLQDIAGSHCRDAGTVPLGDVLQSSQQLLEQPPSTEFVDDQFVLCQ